MANPLDEVTQDRRDDSGNPLRRVYIDTSDAPVAQGTGAGNALTQSMQPTPEAVPWTIEDLQRGVEAVRQYVAGNAAPVNDMAKRFTNYDRQFTQDVINAPATIWNNPGKANEVGQRFMGGENWLSNMVRSATTAPGKALASEVPVTSEEMVAPAQDIAGMATGSMLFGRPGAATLGAGPVRPANMPKFMEDIRPNRDVKEWWPNAEILGDTTVPIEKLIGRDTDRAAANIKRVEKVKDRMQSDKGYVERLLVSQDGHVHEGQHRLRALEDLGVKEVPVTVMKYGDRPNVLFSDSQPGTAISALAQSAKGPAPVFYSALEHAATNAAQETMSPQQWLGFLKNTPGVKAEELAWTGLPEWLGAQKGKVSKKDVQGYLDEHKVEIKDVTKGGEFANEAHVQRAIEAESAQRFDDFADTHDRNPTDAEVRQIMEEVEHSVRNDPDAYELDRDVNSSKYSSYQLPGGENYREHLLTMPKERKYTWTSTPEGHWHSDGYTIKHEPFQDQPAYITYGKDGRRLSGNDTLQGAKDLVEGAGKNAGDNYRSSHWDEPNVLAHVRTNDRTMARELSPEHVAVNEARAKIQQQIEAVKHEQAAVANEISAVVRPLEKARQAQIRADIKAKKVSGADGLRKLEEYYEHPEIKPLQDKLEQLRAKETELGYSIHDIVPRTMTDEQALAAAKDWVNEGNPNSKKWEQTLKVRQDAWLEQVQKVAGRKAMNEAEKPVKSLHIEEIQSDWHQQGRKQGYRPEQEKKMAELKQQREELLAEANKLETSDPRYKEIYKDLPRIQREINDIGSGDVGVPDAPFKTSWPELALKHMIRKAAEEGYDRISWTPGEAQAARYDLSKTVSKVHYMPDLQGGTLAAEGLHPGQTVLDKSGVKPEQIADYIGKDAAEKLLKATKDKDGIHTLEGVDLKVGGEGMREFYDKMLPKMVEKIGKAHGVKVKQTHVATTKDWANLLRRQPESLPHALKEGTAHNIYYFDLPQSLKEHAIGKGFPLYMSGVPFPLTPVDYDPFKKGNK